MNKEYAIRIQEQALEAIRTLNLILHVGSDYEEYAEIKKGVGLSIAYIDNSLLRTIYKQFPELDHIKPKE